GDRCRIAVGGRHGAARQTPARHPGIPRQENVVRGAERLAGRWTGRRRVVFAAPGSLGGRDRRRRHGGAPAASDASLRSGPRTARREPGRTAPVRPMGIVAAPDGSALYVTTGSYGQLFIVDAAANRPVGSVAVGQRPWGVAIASDGKTVYTANGPSNDVSVVDVGARRVVKKI